MKRTFILLLASVTLHSAKAQLADTKWKGTAGLPQPTDLVWVFGKDTSFVYTLPDSVLLETMTYKVENNELTLLKVSGASSCDNSTPGKYKIEIRDEKLYFTLIKDDCQDRASAINPDPFIKVK
ncbi:MAG TPA: hypothetical protein VMI35_06825 [Puia sp.]|nr:hypothetical protein [Puia sp.]